MPFQNYVCWQKDRVYTVMNPDAEHVSDELFLAVHSEFPLTLMEPNVAGRNQGEVNRWSVTPHEFVQRFLAPNRRHVQAVVQGESGSGKSHFIKWLALNIPRRADRYVLTIPKAGMSLRRIVERIIEVLPTAQQRRYVEQLAQMRYHAATREQRRESLINRIAEAIRSDPLRDSTPDAEEAWLIKELPNIFYDPHLRTFLDRPDGIIDELVAHIFEPPKSYRRLDSQRMFHHDDLPLEVRDIKELSLGTRQVFIELANDANLVSRSLDIINRNLNRAIPQVLNFTGDDLIELMLELRRYLHQSGRHLILLIEDFARLQGIDGALLQALIEAGSDDNGLCEMRWAMAVTRGYYEQIANTVHTRTNFLIDMDLPTGGLDGALTDEHIVSFAARYLNAVRLKGEDLLRWREAQREPDSFTAVPNACDACPFRTTCHEAFDDVEGMGLYPFSRNAVLNMVRRRDVRLDERFNPRVLIKDVMGEVLGNYGPTLEEGQFPPNELLSLMGGSKLLPLVEDRLQRATTQPVFLRQRALLGLWSRTPKEPQQLPLGIYDAFALEPPGPEQPTSGPTVEVVDKEFNMPVPSPDRHIEAIRAWGRGEAIHDDTAQELRKHVYQMLETFIDWDAAGLRQTAFARKADGPFRPRFITFVGARTKPSAAAFGVTLTIPLDANNPEERREAAIAFEGLLRFGAHGSWNFPGGLDGLVALGECLVRWSAYLLAEFRKLPDREGKWDPVPSAVEALAVGAALCGRPDRVRATITERLNALFEPWTGIDESQSKQWKELYQAAVTNRESCKDVIQAWASGTKGGRAGNFIDPGKLVPALQAIHSSWVPSFLPPDNLGRGADEYAQLAKLHGRISRELVTAASAEWDRRTGWLMRARQQVPEGASWKHLVAAVQELRGAVPEHGIGCRHSVMQTMHEALQGADKLPFDGLVPELESLRKAKEPRQVLQQLGRRQPSSTMSRTEGFLAAVGQFLNEVSAATATSEAALGDESAALDKDQETIRKSLEQMADALTAIGENHAN